MKAIAIVRELRILGKAGKTEGLSRFFKCGKGEYGEGDMFLGVMVPDQRKIALRHRELPLAEVEKLLANKYHEARLTGLLILVYAFEKADAKMQKKIFEFYITHTKQINNWDLVDVTTPNIVGVYLLKKPKERKILYRFVQSENLWERRMAILATFAFLRASDFSDTLKIAEHLLGDKQDLIHKAVGWMLREVGKRDRVTLEVFLSKHRSIMPRTTLRYAIEHFSPAQRKQYLKR